MKRIILTGGGTAGHVTPNLALISALREEGWEVHYIGTANGMERGLIEPLIKQSGAHIWCDSGDPVFACEGFAAINSPKGGRRVLTLPDGTKITLNLKPYTTEIVEY